MRRSACTRSETLTRNDCQLTLMWRRKVTYITNMQKLIKLNNIDRRYKRRAIIYYFEDIEGYQVVKYLRELTRKYFPISLMSRGGSKNRRA